MSSIYVIRRIKKEHIAENVKLTLSDERLHVLPSLCKLSDRLHVDLRVFFYYPAFVSL